MIKLSMRRSVPVILLLAASAGFSARAGEYRLTVSETGIALIGLPQRAIVANGELPAPTLHWREGEDVILQVSNQLQEETSIHWHGIVLPYDMDGVPGISFGGIGPGQTFTYRFPVKQSGTYWYHGHSGMQEQQGLFGAIVIDPAEPQQSIAVDRDYVVMLSDWPEADPHRTLARLKKQSDYYNFQKRTVGDFFADIERLGFLATLADRLAWGEMRMEPTDIADVTGATYHFLINGKTPASQPTFLFQPGNKIRLRFVNASAMTHFDLRIPGLKLHVIAADGQAVDPVEVEELRIAVAETYDVVVEPRDAKAYAIFAEAMDRSGYAHASLTPREGLIAEVPAQRPMSLLTLDEMGGAHGGGHSGHKVPETAGAVTHDQGNAVAESRSPRQEHELHGGRESNAREPMVEQSEHHAHAGHSPTHPPVALQPLLSYQALTAAEPNHGLMGPPDREITLRLTGNMNRYIWSFDDVKYSAAEPIRVKFGERIRFTYINETMMNHPIHIHGLWQYLDNGKGMYNPKKHVVNVKPGQTVSVDVPADAEGEWAMHCHLLYHMDTGMFRKLIVEKPEHRHD